MPNTKGSGIERPKTRKFVNPGFQTRPSSKPGFGYGFRVYQKLCVLLKKEAFSRLALDFRTYYCTYISISDQVSGYSFRDFEKVFQKD